jgi:hypothetical protein
MKRTIRLTESELRRMVSESVRRVLNEKIIRHNVDIDERCSYNDICLDIFRGGEAFMQDVNDSLKRNGFEYLGRPNFGKNESDSVWQKGDTRVTFFGRIMEDWNLPVRYTDMKTEYSE